MLQLENLAENEADQTTKQRKTLCFSVGLSELTQQRVQGKYENLCLGKRDRTGLEGESRLFSVCGNKLLNGLAGIISLFPRIMVSFLWVKTVFLGFFPTKQKELG